MRERTLTSKPNDREKKAFELMQRAKLEAYEQGCAGVPLAGLALLGHEISQADIASGAYATNVFYDEYRSGLREFGRKAKP